MNAGIAMVWTLLGRCVFLPAFEYPQPVAARIATRMIAADSLYFIGLESDTIACRRWKKVAACLLFVNGAVLLDLSRWPRRNERRSAFHGGDRGNLQVV